MEGYELESVPFVVNCDSSTSFFHGVSLTRNRLSVVVKRHDFSHLKHKSFNQRLSQALNSALIQAKVQHPHSCDVLELQIELDKATCSLFQVWEALQTSLLGDIEERRTKQQTYTEKELWDFLLQTSEALALAHSKVVSTQGIAHKSINPAHIFRTESSYKIGDFGCFSLKRESSYSSNGDAQIKYMSPQLRAACVEGTRYNGFKADVYALGVTVLDMAAVPASTNMESTVEDLRCSTELKSLLAAMMSASEATRPTMQEIHSAATVPVSPLPKSSSSLPPMFPDMPNSLASVEEDKVKLWDFSTRSWNSAPLHPPIEVDIGSRYVWMETGLFVSGGRHHLGWGGEASRREAYEVGLAGVVTRLADMLTPRRSHGLWWLAAKQQVLVFGGTLHPGYSKSYLQTQVRANQVLHYADRSFHAGLRECEALNTQADSWRGLPSMRETRSYFTPCAFHSYIYLCGGFTNLIEVFDAEACLFLPVHPRLPEARECVAVLEGGQLVVISGNYVTRWGVAQEFNLVPQGRTQHQKIEVYCNMAPVLDGTVVYMSWRGSCSSVRLEVVERIAGDS